MEDSLSMPELTAILVAKRRDDHNERRFMAALQGQDIGDFGGDHVQKEQVTFDDIKARVFSGGQAKDAKDILSMQGINAQQAGFGIGMGLEYTDAKDLENPTW
jgi:hypothetical protein